MLIKLNEHETEVLTAIVRRLIMATLDDQVIAIAAAVTALATQVTALQTAVAAIPTTPVAPTVDFTPVLNAVAAVQTTANSILAQDSPTPQAAAPGTATS